MHFSFRSMLAPVLVTAVPASSALFAEDPEREFAVAGDVVSHEDKPLATLVGIQALMNDSPVWKWLGTQRADERGHFRLTVKLPDVKQIAVMAVYEEPWRFYYELFTVESKTELVDLRIRIPRVPDTRTANLAVRAYDDGKELDYKFPPFGVVLRTGEKEGKGLFLLEFLGSPERGVEFRSISSGKYTVLCAYVRPELKDGKSVPTVLIRSESVDVEKDVFLRFDFP